MAELGFHVQEMIGKVDRLDMREAVEHWKARDVDLTRILFAVPSGDGADLWNSERQDHGLEKALDNQLIAQAELTLEGGAPVQIETTIHNVSRTVGGVLSGVIARRCGHEGMPDGAITVRLTGTAGQSFGAFLALAGALALVGDAGDYVGKGLSGGHIIVSQPPEGDPRTLSRTSSSATPCSTEPSPGRPSSKAWRENALRSATPARWRSSRGSATTAANT